MYGPVLLAFGGGVLVGLVFAVLFLKRALKLEELPPPTITSVVCLSEGRIRINGMIDPPPTGYTLVALYSWVYDTEPVTVSPAPPSGAIAHGTSFPLFQTLPGGLSAPKDYVVVWAEYRAFRQTLFEYNSCPSSGSSSIGRSRGVSPAVAEQLEAIPRAYRVSPGSPASGAGGEPPAELAGALARTPEAVLRYVPEASTPAEPFWQARGGPGPVLEWSLRLLHRPGGIGAVLSVVCVLGGREVRLAWVASDWRFHTDNRLTCESDEAGGLSLLVRPE